MQIFFWISCFMFYMECSFFMLLRCTIHYFSFCTAFEMVAHCIFCTPFDFHVFFFADSFSISFSGWNFFFRCAHFYSSIAIFFVCLCIEKLFDLQFNMFPSLLPQPAISMRMFNVRT